MLGFQPALDVAGFGGLEFNTGHVDWRSKKTCLERSRKLPPAIISETDVLRKKPFDTRQVGLDTRLCNQDIGNIPGTGMFI